jgi:hypothetical protein
MTGLIWLVSYPRSGNTWTRLALWTLKHEEPADLDRLGNFARMAINRWMIDAMLECDSGLLTADEIETLRPDLHAMMAASSPGKIVKVHDAWRRTRQGRPVHEAAATQAALYLIRDPRDVAISWARFRGRSIDWAIDYLADADTAIGNNSDSIHTQVAQHLGSWSSNVTSWIDDSGLNPLVVRYEDLLADTHHWMRAIATHLGWSPSDAVIEMAVDATRFDRLSAQERKSGFSERPRSAGSFFRSGKAQGWRGVLSAEQAARVERDHGETMQRFGYL